MFATDLGEGSQKQSRGQEFRCVWFIKEVIPRQPAEGVRKQDRKGGGRRQGPTEGSLNLIPREPPRVRHTSKLPLLEARNLGLPTHPPVRYQVRDSGHTVGLQEGDTNPHALLALSACGERSS